MTNQQIIFDEAFRLMNEGKIGSTGRTIEVLHADGTTTLEPEPEALHTFAMWKKLGRQVKKGQKAITELIIWKNKPQQVEVETDNGTETEEINRMFMKKAFFFTAGQTEKITN